MASCEKASYDKKIKHPKQTNKQTNKRSLVVLENFCKGIVSLFIYLFIFFNIHITEVEVYNVHNQLLHIKITQWATFRQASLHKPFTWDVFDEIKLCHEATHFNCSKSIFSIYLKNRAAINTQEPLLNPKKSCYN